MCTHYTGVWQHSTTWKEPDSTAWFSCVPFFLPIFLFSFNKIQCQRAEMLIKAIQRCFMLFMSHWSHSLKWCNAVKRQTSFMSYFNLCSFRPILSLYCLILTARLYSFLLQAGVRKVEIHIFLLYTNTSDTNDIIWCWYREILWGPLCGSNKSFWHCWPCFAHTEVSDVGFDCNSCNWFKEYLYHRQQCVTVGNDCSVILSLCKGVLHGSILGPVLFTMYIINITSSITNCNTPLYADDTVLNCCAKSAKLSFQLETSCQCKQNLIHDIVTSQRYGRHWSVC